MVAFAYIIGPCKSIVHELSKRREGSTKCSKASNYCIKQTHDDQVTRAQTFIHRHGNPVDWFSKSENTYWIMSYTQRFTTRGWWESFQLVADLIDNRQPSRGSYDDYTLNPKSLALGEPNIQTHSPLNSESSLMMCTIISCQWKLRKREHLKYLLKIVLTEKWKWKDTLWMIHKCRGILASWGIQP